MSVGHGTGHAETVLDQVQLSIVTELHLTGHLFFHSEAVSSSTSLDSFLTGGYVLLLGLTKQWTCMMAWSHSSIPARHWSRGRGGRDSLGLRTQGGVDPHILYQRKNVMSRSDFVLRKVTSGGVSSHHPRRCHASSSYNLSSIGHLAVSLDWSDFQAQSRFWNILSMLYKTVWTGPYGLGWIGWANLHMAATFLQQMCLVTHRRLLDLF